MNAFLRSCLVLIFLTGNFSTIVAGTIESAIQNYQHVIQNNKARMSWFIPFRSFAEPSITDALYSCDGAWHSEHCCSENLTKGFCFPIFYIALPVLQAALEVAATPTVRLCASPYLFYMTYENRQAQKTIYFLREIRSYSNYKKTKNKSKKSYYLNSLHLRPAFDAFQTKTNNKVRVSHFINEVKTCLETKQYQNNGDLWSVDDFVHAAKIVENDEESFSREEKTIEDPEHTQCTICLENKVSGVFYPCNHFISCDECYEKIKQDAKEKDKAPMCPKCRQEIEEMRKIYQ